MLNATFFFVDMLFPSMRKSLKKEVTPLCTYVCYCDIAMRLFACLPDEEDEDEDLEEEEEQEVTTVVYFWQGRDANNMGWLHFTHG